jgi:ABC-type uncharacterized transport system substrate-binding protein
MRERPLQLWDYKLKSSWPPTAAKSTLAGKRIAALVVYPSLSYYERRLQLATLAAHHALPAIYFDRELAEAGGLVSYGTDFTNMYRQVGLHIGRILNGENPAPIPVTQVTKFDLVINLRTQTARHLRAANAHCYGRQVDRIARPKWQAPRLRNDVN